MMAVSSVMIHLAQSPISLSGSIEPSTWFSASPPNSRFIKFPAITRKSAPHGRDHDRPSRLKCEVSLAAQIINGDRWPEGRDGNEVGPRRLDGETGTQLV